MSARQHESGATAARHEEAAAIRLGGSKPLECGVHHVRGASFDAAERHANRVYFDIFDLTNQGIALTVQELSGSSFGIRTTGRGPGRSGSAVV